jgi:ABC superfamily ATP binding cassette transporter, ABC protein
MSRLAATGLRVGYGLKTIIDSLDVAIPDTQVTTIIGPNGCGKSTLLRAMANLLPTQAGEVTLDGTPIRALRRRDLARSLGVLPQTPVAPDGLIVSDLVARGRHPHQAWYRQWSSDDKDEVMTALRMTKVDDLADRTVDSLSGGQRQRVWISLVLAQQTDILFLDEPTTYLDLSHSIEVLELVHRLSREHGRTIVMVLHDLNLALRYSDNLVVMRDGSLKAVGKPQDVISPELLKQVFDLDAVVVECPVTGGPLIVPA